MSNIVGLRGEPIHDPREPNPDVIALAELLLEMARAGEIDGLFAVTHYGDGATSACRNGVQTWSVVGQLDGLRHRVAVDLLDG